MKKEDRITAEFVRELFHYDPETGLFTRRVSRMGRWGKAGAIAGGIKPNGYRVIWIGANFMAHRLAWLYVHGSWPAGQIDHINRVRDDNRIANLRVVTHTENMENRKVQRNNTSGYPGVYPDRCGRRWIARISSKGKWLYLGSFRSAEEASAAYRKAAAELHTHNPAANDSHRSAA
jgi:hypothetical protein